jgi:hypothetical protein
VITKFHPDLIRGAIRVLARFRGASFSSGLALCALIHHFRPAAIDYDRAASLAGCGAVGLAFSALRSLGFPVLLDDSAAPDVVKRALRIRYSPVRNRTLVKDS